VAELDRGVGGDSVPLMMPVIRLTGTLMSRDNAAALMPRAFNSSAKCSPGWIALRAICLPPQ
jgi:hypothetical protein